MPFAFFRLPLELREMIYEEVFQTPSRDGVITPDPSYWRRRQGGDLGSRAVNNGSGLIQSCQQAHNEAVPLLYGNRTFYFDDAPHGDQPSKLDDNKYCRVSYRMFKK